MSNTPLPEPIGIVWSDGMPHHTYAKGQLLAHAAAVSAAKDARIKVLEEQLAVAAMQLINAIGYIEEARAARGDKTP